MIFGSRIFFFRFEYHLISLLRRLTLILCTYRPRCPTDGMDADLGPNYSLNGGKFIFNHTFFKPFWFFSGYWIFRYNKSRLRNMWPISVVWIDFLMTSTTVHLHFSVKIFLAGHLKTSINSSNFQYLDARVT